MKRSYQLAEYTITTHRPTVLEGQIRVAFFSDLHACVAPYEQERLLALLESFAPDLVLCGGDAIVAREGWETEEVFALFATIGERYPFYVGLGNHEVSCCQDTVNYPSWSESYTSALAERKVTVLDNAMVRPEKLTMPLQLCGYTIPEEAYRHFKRAQFCKEDLSVLPGTPAEDALCILLAHHPAILPAAWDWGADLTLCGHFHGGLVRFGTHRGLLSAELWPFPGNAYGHFQKADKHGIISSGCGEHTLPARFHNPRELVGVTLINTHR